MALVTSTEMMSKADKNGYAIGAFNVENMEMVMAVIKACEELNSPAILQTTPSTVQDAGLDLYVANVAAAANKASVPIALHLDHGNSFELAMQALKAGYTSIMIDGSNHLRTILQFQERLQRLASQMVFQLRQSLARLAEKKMTLSAMTLDTQTQMMQLSLLKRLGSHPLLLPLEQHMVFIRVSQSLI